MDKRSKSYMSYTMIERYMKTLPQGGHKSRSRYTRDSRVPLALVNSTALKHQSGMLLVYTWLVSVRFFVVVVVVVVCLFLTSTAFNPFSAEELVVVVIFSLACEDYGQTFDASFSARAFFFFCMKWRSTRTHRNELQFLGQWSVHSCSTSWDDCRRAMPRQLSQSSSTSLGQQGCMRVYL